MANTPRHAPVMVEECLTLLAPALSAQGAVLVDATVGLGGHTQAALDRFPNIRVIGIDRDPKALDLASDRLRRYGDRFTSYLGTYDQIPEALEGEKADGILMDLGVSSMQLDDPDRGFAYAQDTALDMRMDQTRGQTARQFVNEASQADIAYALRTYGEERFANRIARAIVSAREDRPITTTGQLADLIRGAVPAAARRKGGHPAKRTFQAIRIAVNDELDVLRAALPRALASLRVGGRIVVESYQSLEDRMVKKIFAEGAEPKLPPDLPVVAEKVNATTTLKLLTRGAVKPSPEELHENPRSASARLRGAELTAPWRYRE